MWGRVAVVAAVFVAALAGGLHVVLRPGPQVPATRVTPVALAWVAPSYVVRGPDGLVVRSGDDMHVVGGWSARWLPGGERGRVLLSRSPTGRRQVVVDARTGAWGRELRTEGSPGPATTRVDVLRRAGSPDVESLDLDLHQVSRTELPLGRTWDGRPVTVDGATFVHWSTGSGEGWWRVAGREQGDVLVGARVVQLSPSADGAALLGVREPDPPTCAGCVSAQRVVEVDPATGEVTADYGVPGSYDPSWRVTALDRVGSRVAVRFVSTAYVGEPGHVLPVVAQEGTWVYDGDWSLLPGSRTELTWWQGPVDRVVARVDPDEPAWKDGLRLLWLHRDEPAVAIPGELTALGSRDVVVGQVPGQLLPPG